MRVFSREKNICPLFSATRGQFIAASLSAFYTPARGLFISSESTLIKPRFRTTASNEMPRFALSTANEALSVSSGLNRESSAFVRFSLDILLIRKRLAWHARISCVPISQPESGLQQPAILHTNIACNELGTLLSKTSQLHCRSHTHTMRQLIRLTL